ncbi:unnamed protein product [Clonostachys rhizophaga]|uniref:Uncharacterized protein n=1 Tax=Clonostachys rhizophaga TaxID=160324 RepID=A0A9N9VE47_9HYPO|nr:unnamed protein product [Clonostachys rhizophaga]
MENPSADNIPLEDLPAPELLSLNLRRALQRVILDDDTNNATRRDSVQEMLQSLISSDISSMAKWDLKTLSLSYRFFKERQPSKIDHIDGKSVLSFDRLAVHWILSGPTSQPNATSKDDTFSDWACRLAVRLSDNSPNSLQILAISENPQAADLASLIPFRLKTLASVGLLGNLNTVYRQPVLLFRCLVSTLWQIQSSFDLSEIGTFDSDGFADPPPLQPISLQRPAHGEISPGNEVYWGLNCYGSGNMDPTYCPNTLRLAWQHIVRPYKSDFRVYISETEKSLPYYEYALINYRPVASNCDQARIFIQFRSPNSVEEFSTFLEQSRKSTGGNEDQETSAPGEWCTEEEVLICIMCVFQVMRSGTVKFIQSIHKELIRMRGIIRLSPSSSKMKYLLHLEDCLRTNLQGIEHSMATLRTLQLWRNPDEKLKNQLDTIKRDLEFLKTQMGTLLDNVKRNEEVLRQRFQVVQDLRLFRLTILAAIFLPLSFTTSFFGMNIESPAIEGPSGFSNWAKSQLEGLSPELRNSTELLASTIGVSGSLNFNWRIFGITAGCLLLTLPISLAIGSILRAIAKGASNAAIYWRTFLAIVALFCIFVGIGGYYFLHKGVWIGVNSSLLLYGLYVVLRAAVRRKEKPFFWSIIVVFTVFTMSLTLSFDNPFFSFYMFIPYALLFFRFNLRYNASVWGFL